MAMAHCFSSNGDDNIAEEIVSVQKQYYYPL